MSVEKISLISEKDNTIKEMMLSNEYASLDCRLKVPVGKSKTGKVIVKDLSRIPHIIISGTTGSGKTTFVQALLVSLMCNCEPSDVQFVIYDSKGIDYNCFNKSPFLVLPVMSGLKDGNKIITALSWLCYEANNRLQKKQENPNVRFPEIFVILDDYANVYENENLKTSLYRLMQIGRITDIHCIIITAIPTSEILSSEIKNNMPARISFALPSKSASRVILDENGAETLAYPGELLFKETIHMERLAAAYIGYSELENVVKKLLPFHKSFYNDEIANMINSVTEKASERSVIPNANELLPGAFELAFDQGMISVSAIQRRFRIGYNSAAQILDRMEEMGVVAPADGARPRKILLSYSDYCRYKSELDQGLSIYEIKKNRSK